MKIKDIYLKNLKKIIKNLDYIEIVDFPKKSSKRVYNGALNRKFQRCFGMIGMYSANRLVNLITKNIIIKYNKPDTVSQSYKFEYDNSLSPRLQNKKSSLWFIYATKPALKKIIFLKKNEMDSLRTDRGYYDTDIESLLMSNYSVKQYVPLIYVMNIKNNKLLIKAY